MCTKKIFRPRACWGGNLPSMACAEVGQPLSLRTREGYDHSYFFIASFVDEHITFHAKALRRRPL